ncbi:uncharacterized protein L969DRAFT_553730 [Mixia osmundae IAM 14324]|uniref:uncharacterized protein n=1 Tax=Mixia osmundae (strain CBS 9802 / IAM 14324 / JCM 22182 / KY 12970) TaxID=764103 RepID=UPI0004A549D6|nr:uncharacterized protein L969DRAFT_553730 [Mixia osmundae IAM 14324]KEI37863.1 hypothetical protein L969DRAFT_553730 [Mixia osmundae IAM 14324]
MPFLSAQSAATSLRDDDDRTCSNIGGRHWQSRGLGHALHSDGARPPKYCFLLSELTCHTLAACQYSQSSLKQQHVVRHLYRPRGSCPHVLDGEAIRLQPGRKKSKCAALHCSSASQYSSRCLSEQLSKIQAVARAGRVRRLSADSVGNAFGAVTS